MISACFIIKNEEKWLEGCLKNIQSLVSEMIIVDTGSSDRSKEIAEKFGAKIFDFKWVNDFAAARNFCISHATMPWILNLDPDERISERDLERIEDLTSQTEVPAFSFKIRNYSNDSSQTFFYPCAGEYSEFEKDQSGYFETQRVKLFQNGKGIHFVGALHELVETTVSGKISRVDIPIHHFGELPEEKIRKSKDSLYFPILQNKVENNPNDWKAHFELGTQHVGMKNFLQASQSFENALALSKYPQIYSHLGHCYFMCGQIEKAEAIFTEGIALYPKEHDIQFNYASMKTSQNCWNEALVLLQPLVKNHPRSFSAHRAIGYCFLNLSRFQEAEGPLKKALEIFPKYDDARIDLGILRFMQGSKTEAMVEAKKTLEFSPESLRAQGLLKAIEVHS
ncbi:MAG: glycosyl transferase family 2 [Bacteriovoracaceae bacterium]|nr:glycosyl transferase family 2 [Bacteriovoracaceae bacterium]